MKDESNLAESASSAPACWIMDLKDWKEVAKLQHWSESRSEKLQHDLLQAHDINHPGEAREHRIPSLFIVEEIGVNELEEQNASIWDQNTSMSFKGMVTIQKTLQPTCPERPRAPNHGRVSCWLQGHPEVPIAPAVGTGEHTRELEVVRPWPQGLSRCPGKVCSFSLAGGWVLQLLLVLWLGFSGFSWHYPLCPGSDSISVVLQWLWGWWGEACGSVTDYGEPKINPLWKVLGISYCDSSFWAQAGTTFQLWFMWVELLLFAAFQQRGLKVCGFWTSFD